MLLSHMSGNGHVPTFVWALQTSGRDPKCDSVEAVHSTIKLGFIWQGRKERDGHPLDNCEVVGALRQWVRTSTTGP